MQKIQVTDLDKIKEILGNAVLNIASKNNVSYADVRVEAGEGVGAYSEDGIPKSTSLDWNFSFGVRVIVKSPIAAAGFYGKSLGLADLKNFKKVLDEGLSIAFENAKANSMQKALFVKDLPYFKDAIVETKLAKIDIVKTIVKPEFKIDPRKITSEKMTEYVSNIAKSVQGHHSYIKKAEVVANTSINRQIFASSEGAFIDEWHCSTGGTVFIVGQNDKGDKPVDLYHHTGNQLGFEALINGKNSHEKTFEDFAKGIADEVVLLCDAKPAPAEDKDVTVVLDPDLVALFAHEIIGHPSELDRAIKMETGYAGRSWFFKDLENNMVGKQVGSSILTAFSDPTIKGGYGYYLYDDEGTPAKRVYHIKKGIYQDFMNSRQTAKIAGKKPNGHYKANDASVVPLIRMSNSAIAPGKSDPDKILSEVKDGYYCVGHRIPSIAESRENFQIAPRLIYKIRNGEKAEVYRDGRVTADSKDFFMSIDALGNDFKMFPIPNCGKGQPMQAKQVGNGGPTARARAKIARG